MSSTSVHRRPFPTAAPSGINRSWENPEPILWSSHILLACPMCGTDVTTDWTTASIMQQPAADEFNLVNYARWLLVFHGDALLARTQCAVPQSKPRWFSKQVIKPVTGNLLRSQYTSSTKKLQSLVGSPTKIRHPAPPRWPSIVS